MTDFANTTGPEGAGDEPVVGADSTNALLSRLRVIEDQPLDQRAAAYVQLHDVLQSTLEGGDSARVHD